MVEDEAENLEETEDVDEPEVDEEDFDNIDAEQEEMVKRVRWRNNLMT